MKLPDSRMPGKYVGAPILKKDAKALVTGQPVYTDDLAPENCLVIKLLRSPHANALVEEIDAEKARALPGVECVLTHEDVPHHRFTQAGQTFLEASPYDRYILDPHVRFVGDEVAIVAAVDEKTALAALRLIKVKYKVLPAILDYREALDNPVLIHPEDDWTESDWSHGDAKRNLVFHEVTEGGDPDSVMAECDEVIEENYHTIGNQQVMMEPFTTYCTKDYFGRLVVVSSTQIPFHVRRNLATGLGIPKSQIRVIKPRIGGGFGAKQTAVCERFPAVVTWLTGKPSKIYFTREECQIAGSARHEMSVRVKIGAMRDGTIRAIEMEALSNTGAYGEHGPTTVGLAGHKAIPLYGGKYEAFRFTANVVYTNQVSAGAFRGYGAPQGIFALESTINLMAKRLNMDPLALRQLNVLKEGKPMPAYFGEMNNSCTLDKCLDRARQMIDWDGKGLRRVLPNGHIRSLGVAMGMQGSCISHVDEANVTIKLNDDGFYSLLVGCTDMGTGCDTILAQMAADVLECSVDNIVTFGVDTDASPYDSGSYASSTTYLTGGALVEAAQQLRDKIVQAGAKILGCTPAEVDFDGTDLTVVSTGAVLSLKDLANQLQGGSADWPSATAGRVSPVSPPPYMAGMCEIDVDPETGTVTPLRYVGVVDCGTVINPNLARTQAEGGIIQGLGMALYEDMKFGESGSYLLRNLMQYKIPSRMDICAVDVEFVPSYEPTGPFGAKSIGELVIDTPAPALADAIFNATGVMHKSLPITAENVWRGLNGLPDAD